MTLRRPHATRPFAVWRGSSRAVALAALLLAPAGALAQAPAARPQAPPVVRVPAGPRAGSDATVPFYFAIPPDAAARPARVIEPLAPALVRRLRRAQDLRLSGQPEQALDTLRAVQREAPHHPYVVLELARTHLALDDHGAAWTLLRAERSLARDSLLGSAEAELSAERLGRPRDAAQIAVETWVAAPAEGQWSLSALLRLLPQDARATLEALRVASLKHPGRTDLARGLALMFGRQGRPEDGARVLAAVDRPAWRPPVRQLFGEEAVYSGLAADSASALEALVSLAGDTAFVRVLRLGAAHRANQLGLAGGRATEVAARLVRALEGVPPSTWGEDLLLSVSRTLRESGRGGEARALLTRAGELLRVRPELALERSWAQLREGPPSEALPGLDSLARRHPPALYALAEAQFFAGRPDSALANFKRVALDEQSPDAVTALERVYLLEERPGDPALLALGALAWNRWRGEPARAQRLADSLWRALPRESPYSAPAALQLAELRGEARDWPGALVPLMAVADSLPGDRLAPVARQHAGEAWLEMGDGKRALEQFEECLARYPRAWNAAEVRRQVERLRRELRL